MSDALAHDGLIIVNVFAVDRNPENTETFGNPHFVKRGLMPSRLIQSQMPLLIEDNQYEWVEACYDLTHREVMAFVKLDHSAEKVFGAAGAIVPDVARYGASAH